MTHLPFYLTVVLVIQIVACSEQANNSENEEFDSSQNERSVSNQRPDPNEGNSTNPKNKSHSKDPNDSVSENDGDLDDGSESADSGGEFEIDWFRIKRFAPLSLRISVFDESADKLKNSYAAYRAAESEPWKPLGKIKLTEQIELKNLAQNQRYELGVWSSEDLSKPALGIQFFHSSKANSIASLNEASFILKDGVIYSFGNNRSGTFAGGGRFPGVLGRESSDTCGLNAANSFDCSLRPGPLENLPPVQSIITDDGSNLARQAFAIDEIGNVWAWGLNSRGQLGLGDTVNRMIPTKIEGITNVVGLSTGGEATVAIDANDEVWYWGGTRYGSAPTRLNKLPGVVEVFAGSTDFFARTDKGDIYTWGFNSGYFGNKPLDSMTPLKMQGWSDIVEFPCHRFAPYAVNKLGEVFTFIDGKSKKLLTINELVDKNLKCTDISGEVGFISEGKIYLVSFENYDVNNPNRLCPNYVLGQGERKCGVANELVTGSKVSSFGGDRSHIILRRIRKSSG